MIYCYRDTETNEIIELTMTVTELRRKQNADGTILLSNGHTGQRDYDAEHGGFCHVYREYDIWSDAAAIHPDNIKEEMKTCKEHGINDIEFHPEDGRAHFKSRKIRNEYLALKGLHDKDGGYSETSPDHKYTEREWQ